MFSIWEKALFKLPLLFHIFHPVKESGVPYRFSRCPKASWFSA
jgi:hypothetical protein